MIQKRILITGGAGFLGSHLSEKLVHMGHDVLCVDNFTTGTPKNIEHLLSHPNFQVMEHDICGALYVEVDEIYNLASPASPIHYQADPIQTMKTNVLGSLNILETARRCGAKILQASTSEVYGDPLEHPQKEEYWGNVNPIGVRSCYDEGKRCAEALCLDYMRRHGLKVKIVRIFNTYGPKMLPDDGRVVTNLIVQALKGEPLTIYGKGLQTRSFCYVDDLIEGIILMMNHPITGPINLGNPEEYTIQELSQKILSLLKQDDAKIVYKPLPKDDPKQRRPDICSAEKNLNWKPKIDLEEGLEKTISYFKKTLFFKKDVEEVLLT